MPFIPSVYSAEIFFEDDFTSFDTSKWTKYGNYGSNGIIDGTILQLDGGTDYKTTRYAYTNNSYSSDFKMEVKMYGRASSEFFVGICDVSESERVVDISHYIAFKRPANPYYQYVYLVYSNNGADITLWSSYSGQFNTYGMYANFTLIKTGNHYTAYINTVKVYDDILTIDFVDNEYQFCFSNLRTASTDQYVYLDYFYTESNELYASAESLISIFSPVPIANITINLFSSILKIFIDTIESALIVGNVILDNLIDTITTVIRIGQSTLTIIAQASTYIYSGLMTIIDKVVVAINSFNVLIDNIITMFETLYDEDTVYGTIIHVIPLILLLSIPTIVVYYKIGEFATIPMFMFMSIVAYMTSLMPLWILVVALIGCITILIQKQRRSN